MNDEAWVAAIERDYTTATLAADDRAMLDYAAKLTRTPGEMVEADVLALRAVAFADKAIVEINAITGFFAWCNRIVDGLGVELEPFWDEPDASNE